MENLHRLSPWRAAVDTGSDFTTACAYQEDTGDIYTFKVPSIHGDPASSAARAMDGLCEKTGLALDKLTVVVNGATLALSPGDSNILSETALLVTRGFRDLLYTGGDFPPHLYGLSAGTAVPRISRRLTFEINERLLPGGLVAKPLNEEEIAGLAQVLVENKVRSVAVCLLHSFDNPVHELMVREILARRLPGIPVTLSSAILPRAGEYDRTAAAVANAAASPLVSGYIDGFCRYLSGSGAAPSCFFMQFDGSLATARPAALESARMLNSSPAAGILSCRRLARATGRPNLICLDMGGSGCRLGVIHAEQTGSPAPGIKGDNTPGLTEIHTVHYGGSSPVSVDNMGNFKTAPGTPASGWGPACFGGGPLPTLTDANVLLGRISTRRPLPGGIMPDRGAARRAIDEYIAVPLKIPADKAALELIEFSLSGISCAIKRITAGRGYDPGEFTLVCFGSAGSLHAAELAAGLGIPRVLVPRHPGAHPALGMFLSDLHRSCQAFLNCSLAGADAGYINETYKNLEEKAMHDLSCEDIGAERVNLYRSAEIRYQGRRKVINMQAPAGRLTQADLQLLGRSFKVSFQAEYGLPPEVGDPEIVCLRLDASVSLSVNLEAPPALKGTSRQSGLRPIPLETRSLIFKEVLKDIPVYLREDLAPFTVITGPALVEEDGSTTLVLPGMTASTDALGNIIIEVEVKG